ncbi:hypothetical protein BDA96_10G299100 [Sorghum bicolor]|jgi:hypothetical protein|uniref:Uncharacterized protein n=1 Tax=Sorghum bicolor TaxID=4558 RepID=A0A921Q5L3_SORBI|nr:hypothetical protein BDA96_10G299100 [Sorghum bicolor]
MCGSLALNMCGVACGRLDLCYEMGFGGLWYGSTKYMRHGFIVPFLIHECILDYINYHMQLSESINYEKYIVVFIKYIPRIKP